MLSLDPAELFALKMTFCLALFLLGAAWLRRRVAKVRHASGLPPEGASALEALTHYFGTDGRGADHERLLHRQTIRVLARELQRLDPVHPEARAALELVGEPPSAAGTSIRVDPAGVSDGRAEPVLGGIG